MSVLLAGATVELNEALASFLDEVVRGRPWQVRAQSPEELQVAVYRRQAAGIATGAGIELWRIPTVGEPEQLEQTFSLTLSFDAEELTYLQAEYADHARDADENGVPAHPSQRAVWEALISEGLMERDERDVTDDEREGVTT